MQSVRSRIWTRVTVSISYDDNDTPRAPMMRHDGRWERICEAKKRSRLNDKMRKGHCLDFGQKKADDKLMKQKEKIRKEKKITSDMFYLCFYWGKISTSYLVGWHQWDIKREPEKKNARILADYDFHRKTWTTGLCLIISNY